MEQENRNGTKGIILAGGSGTRLYPITKGISKQLLPVYSKPMIYYPLSSLMLAGIRDILVITTPHDQESFQRVLGDGSWIGLNISWAVQPKPEGLAQSFLIGEEFISSDRVALALGDNIFFGHGLPKKFGRAARRLEGATIFGYEVRDPERYGVVEFGPDGEPVRLIEKPQVAPSPYAITGLYFYDSAVVEIARNLKPSERGELEITDVNKEYLERGKLFVEKLGRGNAWFDTGTYESMLSATLFVQTIEERQGLMVACVEEIAYRLGYITIDRLEQLGRDMQKNLYGQYLLRLVADGPRLAADDYE